MEEQDRPSLEASFLRFARGILAKVKAKIEQDGLKTIAIEVMEFTDSGYGPEVREVPGYAGVVRELHGATLWTMPEAEAAARVHLERNALHRPVLNDRDGSEITNPTFDQVRPHLICDLLAPIEHLLRREKSADLSDEALLAEYREFIAYQWRGERPWEATIPILGASGDLSSGLLENGVELRAMTPADRASIFQRAEGMGVTNASDLHETKFLLSYRRATRGDRHVPERDVLLVADRVLSALRLHRAGRIGTRFVVDRALDRYAQMAGYASPVPGSTGKALSGSYSLVRDEWPAVLRLYQQLRQTELASVGLETSLRRFNYSYSRPMGEDRIIDLMIALEATLLAGLKDELKNRLALRGANLLRSLREPTETYALLSALYDARSAIVHGGKTLEDKKLTKDIRKQLPDVHPRSLPAIHEEIVRQVLREYLRLFADLKTVQGVNKELDRRLLASLRVT